MPKVEWLVAFMLGTFTGFQAWVGIMLVGLIRDVAVLKTMVTAQKEAATEASTAAKSGHEDHEGRIRALESRRRPLPQH